MFEKTLQDLVKGIRSHKRDPSAFISQSIQEIKQELRSTDPFVKGQVGSTLCCIACRLNIMSSHHDFQLLMGFDCLISLSRRCGNLRTCK